SNEVAHAQAAPLFAWTLVSSDTPEMRDIREKTILVLVPDMNPDGTTMIADWYRAHRGQPWEMTLPGLYQRYAGHDNNRDWFMFTQQETRNIGRQLYDEYLPQIVYDHHQTAPFPARIFIPPFVEPTNAHIPPPVLRGIDTIGR
ncbi:M14 family zinc carboxypeptidase, partial [Bradyrhizobium sp. NBAIM08]|uniref:M14 family zinc carboxypeptidase n=1 Tax=Bradyrhizobium sp. NBAIM08 TaxID=2793815 RepID=UPI001CD3364F